MKRTKYRAIVIGASAGGIEAVIAILVQLPAYFSLPIIIAQHLQQDQDNYLIQLYNNYTHLNVKEAEEKEEIVSGYVYIAPPDYHLLIEKDETFSLSMDEKVNYSRPSIDVLFESAADAYGAELVGVILTGANNDGAYGLKRIKERGGLALVENPETAKFAAMPRSALEWTKVDHTLTIDELGKFVTTLQSNYPL